MSKKGASEQGRCAYLGATAASKQKKPIRYLLGSERAWKEKKNWQGVIIKLALWGEKRCKTVTETGHNQNGFIIKLKKGKTPNFIYVSNSIAS